MQAASAMILNVFCKETKMEYEDYLSQLFRATIGLLSHSDIRVLTAAWDCINSIVKVRLLLSVFSVCDNITSCIANVLGYIILYNSYKVLK